MCSSTRGPAIWPSLVTWPISRSGAAALLGEADQRLGRGAQLGHGAGRLLEPVDPHGLDRIDDHQVRRVRAGRPWPGCRRPRWRWRAGPGRAGEAEARRAQPDLVDRLLAADVDHRAPARRRSPPRPGASACSCRCRGRRRSASPHRRTMPPPSTRSSSSMPLGRRGGGAVSPASGTSSRRRPLRLAAGGRRPGSRPPPRRCCSRRRTRRSGRPSAGGRRRSSGRRRRAAPWPSGPRCAAAPTRIGPSARPWMNWST